MDRIIQKAKRLLKREDIRQFMRTSWDVSWPMTIIVFIQFLLGITGVFISGRYGKEYQAAFGIVIQFYFVFIVIANALTVGTVSIISRLFTSNRHKEYKESIHSTLIFSIFVGFALSMIGYFGAKIIFYHLNVPEVVKPMSISLFQLYVLGLAFTYPFIISNGVLRAIKRVKKSLINVIISFVVAMIFRFYFCYGTDIGFIGLGISAMIGSLLGTILNLLFLKKFIFDVVKFSFKPVFSELKIGWPAGATQISWQGANMIIYLIIGILPFYQVETMAALTNGLRTEAIVFLPAFAFSLANAVVVGNLLGENKSNDAYLSGLITAAMGVFVALIITITLTISAHLIVPFFSDNQFVINESLNYIYIAMIAQPFLAWEMSLVGALNGAGDTKSVLKIIVFCMFIIRVPLCYILGVLFNLGSTGIWWSMTISLVVQATLISKRYFGKKWLELSV